MIGRRMARGRRVGAMQVSRSKQGGDGRRRATGGPTRGRRLARTGRLSARGRQVGGEAGWSRRGRSRGARGSTAAAGDANRSRLDRKTKKKNADQNDRRESEKSGARAREKDSLWQPVNTTGGRTLGTGGAAPGGGHGGRPPGGGARVRKRRRLGFRIDLQ